MFTIIITTTITLLSKQLNSLSLAITLWGESHLVDFL